MPKEIDLTHKHTCIPSAMVMPLLPLPSRVKGSSCKRLVESKHTSLSSNISLAVFTKVFGI
jgi:hypothetical protein